MSLEVGLRAAIESVLSEEVAAATPVRGGDINDAFRLSLSSGRTVFAKVHRDAPEGMFASEAYGLGLLRGPLRVPAVLGQSRDFLLLEDLGAGSPNAGHDDALGHGLATLHRQGAEGASDSENLEEESEGTSVQTKARREEYLDSSTTSNAELNIADERAPFRFLNRTRAGCGGRASGFIATLAIDNSVADWPSFYLRRLQSLIERSGLDVARAARFDALRGKLRSLLSDAPIALLHGDLWRGNVHTDGNGDPCLVDPSVYYGDPEVDLAMMHLFGGFSQRVFDAYDAANPPRAGRCVRRVAYQLYPVLVHLVLFGGGYANQLDGLLGQLE